MKEMKKFLLEVCVDSAESAMTAFYAGADRLELCSNLILGGTTPDVCLYKQVRKYCSLPIYVLIRPRFGDFCYSDYEYEIIKEEIKMFRELGTDGIVTGILKPDGTMNLEQMEEIMNLAGNIPVTLHRAFDVSADPLRTFDEAGELGIHTILTSGQRNKCTDDLALIRELSERNGRKPEILVGGGVNVETVRIVRAAAEISSFHMSGKVIGGSRMQYRQEDVHMGLPGFSEYQVYRADEKEIAGVADFLKHLSEWEKGSE